MSPRRIAQEVTIHGATLARESRAFLMFGSANRDEAHFVAADQFRPSDRCVVCCKSWEAIDVKDEK